MTKVTIISGFLGAGKTTLIRKLLEEVFKGEKIVLIENEYGEIGIDGSFLKDSGVEITEMNSGCICCTLVGDFTEALGKVIDQFAPDRIIIEPSGVGKLSDIVGAVEKVKKAGEEIVITEKIAVVDAKKAKIYMKNFGEFFKNQVHYASTVVLSRTQDVNEEKLNDTVALLRTENAEAPFITTPWTELSADAIRHALEHSDVETLLDLPDDEDDDDCCCHHHHHDDDDDDEHEHHHHHHHDDDDDDDECCCHHHHDDDDDDDDEHEHEHHHHHHHHHHADEVFTSWGRETAKKFTEEELAGVLAALKDGSEYGTILRSKGIIAMADGSWKQFDLVPEESEIRESAPDYTSRICVIGCDLNEDKLAELFGIR